MRHYPFIYKNNELFVFLIKQNNGVIAFPKGHVESGESELETALRECYEETGLTVKIVEGFKEEINYYMPEYGADKTVVYFIGIIDNLDIHKQGSEVSEVYLANKEEALNLLSFEQSKELFNKALTFLENLK